MEHKETLSTMHDMPTKPMSTLQPNGTEDARLEDAETVRLEAAPGKGQPQKRRWLRRSVVINALLLCALLLFDGSAAAFGFQTFQHYYGDYQHYLSMARSGIQQLQTAERQLAAYPQNPLDNQRIVLAQREFSAAQANFTQDRKSV